MNCEHMMDLSLHDNGEDFDVRIYNVPDERLIGVSLITTIQTISCRSRTTVYCLMPAVVLP